MYNFSPKSVASLIIFDIAVSSVTHVTCLQQFLTSVAVYFFLVIDFLYPRSAKSRSWSEALMNACAKRCQSTVGWSTLPSWSYTPSLRMSCMSILCWSYAQAASCCGGSRAPLCLSTSVSACRPARKGCSWKGREMHHVYSLHCAMELIDSRHWLKAYLDTWW